MWESDVGSHAEQVLEFVDLEQHSHLEPLSEDEHIDEFGFFEAFGDQEDGVGTVCSGLPDLPGVDNEVLAQNWQRNGLSDSLNV